ncbi:hypothetical protein GECvBMG_gp019c [Salmonella phage GEC_vB_MG]|nr:hypothetical protein GECvBMG_gp019c [Salmonella phage GEC_vB_MG]
MFGNSLFSVFPQIIRTAEEPGELEDPCPAPPPNLPPWRPVGSAPPDPPLAIVGEYPPLPP